MTDTPANVSDDLYARLRKQFSEEQLMQLGAQIAFENYRARWNRIFNVESDNLYTPQPNKSQESRSRLSAATMCLPHCVPYFVWSILRLGYTPACSSDFAKASQMSGVHSHAIAPDAASAAEHTRRHIAVRLLPFVFPLVHHQLPRSHQRGLRGAWNGARPEVRRSRVRLGNRHFLPQLCGLTNPWRHAGSTVERARDDLRNHDRVGNADRAHRNRAHSRTTLPRTLFVRRG